MTYEYMTHSHAQNKEQTDRHCTDWTEQDDAKLKELYRRGVNMKAIATILGRTKKSVIDRVSLIKKQRKNNE